MKAPSWLRGWLPVAGKEWRATLLSPRLLIIASILALAVVGGAFAVLPGSTGPNQTPKFVTYAFIYNPDLNITHQAIAIFVASPTGEHLSGIKAQLENFTTPVTPGPPPGPPTLPTYQVLNTTNTDSSGWVRFDRLWEKYPNNTLAVVFPDLPQATFCCADTHKTQFAGGLAQNQGVLLYQSLNLGGSFAATVSLVFVDTKGVPQADADVFVWKLNNTAALPTGYGERSFSPPGGWTTGYRIGATDAGGYYINPQPYGAGIIVLHASKGGLNDTRFFGSSGTSTPLSGPDAALAFAGFLFIPLILPIMALAIAYDGIARERSEGSLDLLLSKPVSRVGVALGKILGVFGSALVPVVIIILVAAGLFWATTRQAPTGSFLAGLVGSVLFLLLSYSLLFLAVSALSRSMGTALLVSVLFFLLFAFFWSLISLLLAGLAGPVGSVAWFQAEVALSLFSPTGAYMQFLSQSLSGLVIGFGAAFSGTSFQPPGYWAASAAIAWIIVPLTLFVWTIKYRVSEA